MFETKLSKLKVAECWKLLNLQSWTLKVVWKLSNIEVVESWKLSELNVESWKLSKLKVESCRMLKVVESSKLNLESCRMLKVLNIESLLICCLLTSFQRRSYCKQSDIKRTKKVKNFEKSYIPKEILRVRVFYSSW